MTRDSKGRFKKCPLRRIKEAVKAWWRQNEDNVIGSICAVLCVFVAVTGYIWLFGDKVTPVCHPEERYKTNGTEPCQWNNNDSCFKYESYMDECPWFTTTYTHSRYTIPESLALEWNTLPGIVGSFAEWILAHPVI
ncbi:hypothetical protein M0R72_15200 [Candidatus Pacearchaeota archaeon]|jgi:hypothetical protein|nr:hypothetical protein [Candidatus Pacearchaeota archaeon]